MKKKTYINEDGEKVTVFDISKDFNKFIKRNHKLLMALSKN